MDLDRDNFSIFFIYVLYNLICIDIVLMFNYTCKIIELDVELKSNYIDHYYGYHHFLMTSILDNYDSPYIHSDTICNGLNFYRLLRKKEAKIISIYYTTENYSYINFTMVLSQRYLVMYQDDIQYNVTINSVEFGKFEQSLSLIEAVFIKHLQIIQPGQFKINTKIFPIAIHISCTLSFLRFWNITDAELKIPSNLNFIVTNKNFKLKCEERNKKIVPLKIVYFMFLQSSNMFYELDTVRLPQNTYQDYVFNHLKTNQHELYFNQGIIHGRFQFKCIVFFKWFQIVSLEHKFMFEFSSENFSYFYFKYFMGYLIKCTKLGDTKAAIIQRCVSYNAINSQESSRYYNLNNSIIPRNCHIPLKCCFSKYVSCLDEIQFSFNYNLSIIYNLFTMKFEPIELSFKYGGPNLIGITYLKTISMKNVTLFCEFYRVCLPISNAFNMNYSLYQLSLIDRHRYQMIRLTKILNIQTNIFQLNTKFICHLNIRKGRNVFHKYQKYILFELESTLKQIIITNYITQTKIECRMSKYPHLFYYILICSNVNVAFYTQMSSRDYFNNNRINQSKWPNYLLYIFNRITFNDYIITFPYDIFNSFKKCLCYSELASHLTGKVNWLHNYSAIIKTKILSEYIRNFTIKPSKFINGFYLVDMLILYQSIPYPYSNKLENIIFCQILNNSIPMGHSFNGSKKIESIPDAYLKFFEHFKMSGYYFTVGVNSLVEPIHCNLSLKYKKNHNGFADTDQTLHFIIQPQTIYSDKKIHVKLQRFEVIELNQLISVNTRFTQRYLQCTSLSSYFSLPVVTNDWILIDDSQLSQSIKYIIVNYTSIVAIYDQLNQDIVCNLILGFKEIPRVIYDIITITFKRTYHDSIKFVPQYPPRKGSFQCTLNFKFTNLYKEYWCFLKDKLRILNKSYVGIADIDKIFIDQVYFNITDESLYINIQNFRNESFLCYCLIKGIIQSQVFEYKKYFRITMTSQTIRLKQNTAHVVIIGSPSPWEPFFCVKEKDRNDNYNVDYMCKFGGSFFSYDQEPSTLFELNDRQRSIYERIIRYVKSPPDRPGIQFNYPYLSDTLTCHCLLMTKIGAVRYFDTAKEFTAPKLLNKRAYLTLKAPPKLHSYMECIKNGPRSNEYAVEYRCRFEKFFIEIGQPLNKVNIQNAYYKQIYTGISKYGAGLKFSYDQFTELKDCFCAMRPHNSLMLSLFTTLLFYLPHSEPRVFKNMTASYDSLFKCYKYWDVRNLYSLYYFCKFEDKYIRLCDNLRNVKFKNKTILAIYSKITFDTYYMSIEFRYKAQFADIKCKCALVKSKTFELIPNAEEPFDLPKTERVDLLINMTTKMKSKFKCFKVYDRENFYEQDYFCKFEQNYIIMCRDIWTVNLTSEYFRNIYVRIGFSNRYDSIEFDYPELTRKVQCYCALKDKETLKYLDYSRKYFYLPMSVKVDPKLMLNMTPEINKPFRCYKYDDNMNEYKVDYRCRFESTYVQLNLPDVYASLKSYKEVYKGIVRYSTGGILFSYAFLKDTINCFCVLWKENTNEIMETTKKSFNLPIPVIPQLLLNMTPEVKKLFKCYKYNDNKNEYDVNYECKFEDNYVTLLLDINIVKIRIRKFRELYENIKWSDSFAGLLFDYDYNQDNVPCFCNLLGKVSKSELTHSKNVFNLPKTGNIGLIMKQKANMLSSFECFKINDYKNNYTVAYFCKFEIIFLPLLKKLNEINLNNSLYRHIYSHITPYNETQLLFNYTEFYDSIFCFCILQDKISATNLWSSKLHFFLPYTTQEIYVYKPFYLFWLLLLIMLVYLLSHHAVFLALHLLLCYYRMRRLLFAKYASAKSSKRKRNLLKRWHFGDFHGFPIFVAEIHCLYFQHKLKKLKELNKKSTAYGMNPRLYGNRSSRSFARQQAWANTPHAIKESKMIRSNSSKKKKYVKSVQSGDILNEHVNLLEPFYMRSYKEDYIKPGSGVSSIFKKEKSKLNQKTDSAFNWSDDYNMLN